MKRGRAARAAPPPSPPPPPRPLAWRYSYSPDLQAGPEMKARRPGHHMRSPRRNVKTPPKVSSVQMEDRACALTLMHGFGCPLAHFSAYRVLCTDAWLPLALGCGLDACSIVGRVGLTPGTPGLSQWIISQGRHTDARRGQSGGRRGAGGGRGGRDVTRYVCEYEYYILDSVSFAGVSGKTCCVAEGPWEIARMVAGPWRCAPPTQTC